MALVLRLSLLLTIGVGLPALASPPQLPEFVWEGPTPAQSVPFPGHLDPDVQRPAEGTAVKVSAATKATARVFDVYGVREVPVPGTFEASGPVRIHVRFAEDDFFEALVVLPEDTIGKPIEIKVPTTRSQHLIAGSRRVPVSRGVKVVTFRDDPKRYDLAAMPTDDGMPPSGPRWVAPGKKGVTFRQLVFHLTHTDTVQSAIKGFISRSLSTHLLIGQDGTVYQLIDLEQAAYHAGEANMQGVGIDLVQAFETFPFEDDMTVTRYKKMKPAEIARWLKDAKPIELSLCDIYDPERDAPRRAIYPSEEDREPTPYDLPRDLNAGIKSQRLLHPIVGPTKINGAHIRSYGPTPAAMESVVLVSSALMSAYPAIPRSVASTFEGRPIMGIAHEPRLYGLVGHYHWDAQRLDPGPGFDWQGLVNLIITMH